MEYIEWNHINKYVFENPDKINDIFSQLIKWFVYLDENSILHRDIRPENIMVSDEGIAKKKLTDNTKAVSYRTLPVIKVKEIKF